MHSLIESCTNANMKQKRVVLRLLGYAFMMSVVVSGAMGANRNRPNIIFMYSDDHAWQAVSAYGSRLAKVAPTPHIDRLARDGMRFDRFCVTNSICAPCRAVILTGKHSHLNGVKDNGTPFDGSQQTFPKCLQAAGYQTALVGKWHLHSTPTGFDHWEVYPGQGYYYNPVFITPEGEHAEQGYVSDITTEKAIDWLKKQRDPDRPFMLMYQQKAPHRPWQPGLDKLRLFDEGDIPEPAHLFDNYSTRASAARTQTMEIGSHMYLGGDLKVWDDHTRGTDPPGYLKLYDRMDKAQQAQWDAAYGPKNLVFKHADLSGNDLVRWKYQRYMKDYLRCISSVDDGVGKLLNYLDASGLAENTVVIYSSDQGFFLGEHGWFDKRFMYEEALRSPFLIRWPGVVKPGSVNKDLVQNLDVAQTLLDIAGVEQPANMQGESFVPLLKGKRVRDWRKALYYHYYEHWAHSVAQHEGVTTDRYKLIHFYLRNEWEFYDLKQDPHEMENLFHDPRQQKHIVKMKAELKRLRKHYRVPDEYVKHRD